MGSKLHTTKILQITNTVHSYSMLFKLWRSEVYVQYEFLIGNDFALIGNSGQLNFGLARAELQAPPFPIRTAFLIRNSYSMPDMCLVGE